MQMTGGYFGVPDIGNTISRPVENRFTMILYLILELCCKAVICGILDEYLVSGASEGS